MLPVDLVVQSCELLVVKLRACLDAAVPFRSATVSTVYTRPAYMRHPWKARQNASKKERKNKNKNKNLKINNKPVENIRQSRNIK